MNALLARPTPQEYPSYFDRYVSLVPWTDPQPALERQRDATTRFMQGIDAERACYRYAPSKWTVAEVLGHVIDVERMLAYWMWCFARNDGSLRPAVNCEAYAAEARFDQRSVDSLVHEYRQVRQSTLAFASTLDPALLDRHGLAGGGNITVRALLYINGGHELHHLGILRDRYDVSGSNGSVVP